MAIAKDISIHAGVRDADIQDVKDCLDYVTNVEKVDISNYEEQNKGVKQVLNYAENVDKTMFTMDGDEDILVSGYLCTPETAALQFQMDRDLYHDIHGHKKLGKKKDANGNEIEKEEIVAHHIIQSFEYDKTLDPRFVHWLGQEFVKRAFPGCRAVISTHMNTNHLHNHIVICAYQNDGSKKIGMNTERCRQYREVNDEISMEYGLPILLERASERTQQSYAEWMALREGNSWKQALKNDISEAIQITKSWDEYVELMQDNGYGVEEHEDFVTYTVPSALSKNGKFQDRKVRDRTLGEGFRRNDIVKKFEDLSHSSSSLTGPEINEPSKRKTETEGLHKDLREQTTYKINFSINRFDNTGRRRSDLEIMLLKAIKIIKYFINNDKYWNPDKAAKLSSPVFANPEKKLELMEKTLKQIQEIGFENSTELAEALNSVGIQLSHVKRECRDLENVVSQADNIVDLIDRIKALQQDPDVAAFGYEQLHIPHFTQTEVSLEKAKIMPMTAQQRRELFLATQENQDYVLLQNYDKLSFEDAKACIDFLNHKTDKQPDMIVDADHALEIKYKKALDQERASAKTKLSKLNVTEKQKRIAQQLADTYGLAIDVNSLNKYQYTQLVNCLSNNPFTNSPIVSGDFKKELDTELRTRKIQIGRDVTEKEAKELLDYFTDSKDMEMPAVLKDSYLIRPMQLNQINELLELRNETCFLPLETLTEADGYRLRDLLLYKGSDPDLQTENSLYTQQFLNEIKDLPMEQTKQICEYRDLVRDLKKIGISIEDIDRIKSEKELILAEYDKGLVREKELSAQYADLKQISYNLSLSQNKSFTAGLLADYTEIKAEIDNEPNKEKKQEKENYIER